ncbi:hypothetical protein TIFTF001_025047 [Ficus carica]|uniref:IMS import disulfide relay-system CHCH-CHCH-like Cx9C domain-containing protein n=1 Tax=Ficus carica TaxID=3494 RepID=A0AA88DDV4_FICCA|nr:hypothetical protein TIFTF001_025047 [Ficus carica]
MDILISATVDMKERKTTSTLQRILVNCAAQAKEYGTCVAAKVPEVERDMCLKEFLALKSCMQNTVCCGGRLEECSSVVDMWHCPNVASGVSST